METTPPLSPDEVIYDWRFLQIIRQDLWWWKKWETVQRPGNMKAVAGLLRHPENRSIILIDQYRYPVKTRVIELVAGLLDKPDLSMEDTLREEIVEESWFRDIGDMKFLWETSWSAGMTSETAFLYDAEVFWERWEQNLEETEDIKVIEVAEADIMSFLKSKQKEGQLIDPKICMALFMAQENIWNIF